MPKAQRQSKECVGCADLFITYKDYDYCAHCAVNNNRYLSRSNCSECDGSGRIKFKNQKPRPCKLCALTKNLMKKTNKTVKLSPEEKYWAEVEERSKEIIDRLFNTNLPINFSPKDIDLEKSIDWRVIARDDIPQFYQEEEELPNQEYLAEQIAYHYLLTILKRFIDDLSEYDCHDPTYFEQLTN